MSTCTFFVMSLADACMERDIHYFCSFCGGVDVDANGRTCKITACMLRGYREAYGIKETGPYGESDTCYVFCFQLRKN